MYCIKCGVKLESTELKCPLCGTVPFHPDIEEPVTSPSFPENSYPKAQINSKISLVFISVLFLLAGLITCLCDLQINRTISWSGIVLGALIVAYTVIFLPFWFKRPNLIVFTPCSFAAIGLYLAYINDAFRGNWFLTFAFPLVGTIGLITTAVVTLIKCLKNGYLYIFGGALLAYGAFMFPLEILINITFDRERFVFWSIYPMTALILLGGFLIFVAIYKPAKESMAKKLFL